MSAEKTKDNPVKSFLTQVELYDTHINHKMVEVERLYDLLYKVTPTLKADVVQGSGNADPMGDTVAKIVDLQNEINAEIDALVDRKKQINEMLDYVTDPDELAVLYMRYFEFKTFEEIAYELHCTYRNVCYIHGRALNTLAEIMKKQQLG